ncbi:MAG TPA: hypothetical protein VK395_27005 [Gemmataceae bacterium]|nr:hypothetical protein [Gemmataceae bacterium]
MTTANRRRFALATALAVCLLVAFLAPGLAAPDKVKTEYYKGKVVSLADALEKFGSHLDPDAVPHWLALVADDGKTYPLIKDEGARMFFKDDRLLNRPMRLTGRILPGSQLLQVVEVHSYVKGELHELYYWCDVCSIKRFEKKKCDCCGGPMELREVPVKK